MCNLIDLLLQFRIVEKVKHPHQHQNTTRTNQYENYVENYRKIHIFQTSITITTIYLQTIQTVLHIHETTSVTDI